MTILARNFTISNNASVLPPPPPSITVNGSSNAVVAPGASVAVAVANGPGNPKDWVGLYAAGQPDNSTNFLAWVYLNGTQTAPSTGVTSASVKMTAPNINGSYEARFYANDGFTILARVTFTVQTSAPPPPPPSPSITVNGSSNAVVAPGASVAVAVANGPGNPKDWVGLYAAGQPDNSTNFLAWVYLNGTQTAPSTGVTSASVKMTAPNINGSYEARFYANDGFTILARVTFTVQTSAPPPPPPPPSVSPDGSIIYGGKAGSLTTSEGTWTFGAQASDGVDWYIQLNGSQNGWGFQMQITNGKLYTVNKANGHWYLRQNAAWVDVGTTAPVESAPPPPPSVSPDGSIIYGGKAGSLTTSEGTWTFGAQASDGVDWYIQLNGSQNGWGFQMQITNGKLYTVNKANGHWYLRKNAAWVDVGTTAPVEGVLPTPTAITLSPASATIADNAPAGTLIATATVTMSDGSQFAGVLTTSDINFFAISGHNIVTARAYTSADDGTHSTVITASQSGQSSSIKFSV